MVEATDGSRAPARLNTTERGMQITGADATSSHLLVWNSSQAEVHAANGAGGFNRASSFDWCVYFLISHMGNVTDAVFILLQDWG